MFFVEGESDTLPFPSHVVVVVVILGEKSLSESKNVLKYKTLCFCLVAQSCPTLCNPVDCSLPGSSVHGDLDREAWRAAIHGVTMSRTGLSD